MMMMLVQQWIVKPGAVRLRTLLPLDEQGPHRAAVEYLGDAVHLGGRAAEQHLQFGVLLEQVHRADHAVYPRLAGRADEHIEPVAIHRSRTLQKAVINR